MSLFYMFLNVGLIVWGVVVRVGVDMCFRLLVCGYFVCFIWEC